MTKTESLLSALDVLADLPVALKFVRAVRGKSMRDVKAETGISAATIQRTEAGTMPTTEHAITLALWVAGTPTYKETP